MQEKGCGRWTGNRKSIWSGLTVQWCNYMALSYSFPWRQSHEGLSDYKDEEQEDGPYVMDTEWWRCGIWHTVTINYYASMYQWTNLLTCLIVLDFSLEITACSFYLKIKNRPSNFNTLSKCNTPALHLCRVLYTQSRCWIDYKVL